MAKLGGSLASSENLLAWLKALAKLRGRLIIVPGGGPFADEVRALQRRWAFDQKTAHHLALLAMEQYGRMLAALDPRLDTASSRLAIRRSLRQDRVPVWLPASMVVGRKEIPANWEVTADSLALWLAEELGAARLLLIKACEPPAGRATATELSAAGLLDHAFPRFLATARCEVWCCGPGEEQRIAAALLAGEDSGTRIVPTIVP